MVHYNITQKATQRRGLSVPNRGPSPQAASPFFPILLRDQNRGNATQQNAIAGGCNRWPLIISNYILFYIACNLRRRFSLLEATKLKEGHEDQHCNTGLGNKKASEIVSNGSPFVFQFVDCWFSGRIVCHASRAKFCRAHFRGWANECRKLRPWSCQLQSTISKASG